MAGRLLQPQSHKGEQCYGMSLTCQCTERGQLARQHQSFPQLPQGGRAGAGVCKACLGGDTERPRLTPSTELP